MNFKNLIYYTFILFLIGACNDANVTPNFGKGFIKYYGGAGTDIASRVELTNDGGYVLIGTTSSFGDLSPQMYVVKADQYGNTQWERNYGGIGIDSGRAVKQTNDGGYILFGSYQTTITGKSFSSMYLVKMTSSGDTSWTKLYNENVKQNVYGLDLALGLDGSSYLLAGTIYNTSSSRNDGYIRKVNSNGDILLSVPSSTSPNRYPNSISEVSGNNIYWFGSGGLIYGDSKVPTPIIAGLNSSGNSFFAYDKTAPNILKGEAIINDMQNVAEAQATSDGGYILTGKCINNGISSAYILKLNNVGGNNYVEKSFYKEFQAGAVTYGNSVVETSDGGFVMVGTTFSTDKSEGGGFDVYVVKTDNNGNKLWDQTFGGSSDDYGASIKQTPDGGYIIACTMSLLSSPADNKVMCLIKIDDKGEIKNK